MTYKINTMPDQISAALIGKCTTVETATVGHRRHMGFMDKAIQCVLTPRRVAGTAITLALPGQDSTLLHHIIAELRSGDFLCIDRLGDSKHACLGGGVAAAIKASGCVGVAIDGPCTDLPEIQEYDLPVWSRGVSPVTTRIYDIGGSFNVPISCGGVVVNPGDVVIADFSGVLVMPPDEAEAEADWALGKQAAEPDGHKLLLSGSKLGDLSGATNLVRAKTEA
ncbi:MAG: RraA family protein [Arenicellales bacterium]|jgi:regulator of RNase E activity RraA|nr:RraA family protein [Arenicellales bacterium]MDP7524146.1 RraA family protein [Arenicellales bacterium]